MTLVDSQNRVIKTLEGAAFMSEIVKDCEVGEYIPIPSYSIGEKDRDFYRSIEKEHRRSKAEARQTLIPRDIRRIVS